MFERLKQLAARLMGRPGPLWGPLWSPPGDSVRASARAAAARTRWPAFSRGRHGAGARSADQCSTRPDARRPASGLLNEDPGPSTLTAPS